MKFCSAGRRETGSSKPSEPPGLATALLLVAVRLHLLFLDNVVQWVDWDYDMLSSSRSLSSSSSSSSSSSTTSQTLTTHRASTSTGWNFAFALCCHSNETRAPVANLPNSVQLEGTPTDFPKLHPDPCSSVGMQRGTDTETETQTHRRPWALYISRRLRLTRNVNRLRLLQIWCNYTGTSQ